MNVLSPEGWMHNKLKGEASTEQTRIPLETMPSFSNSRRRKDPMKSFPIFVKIAAGIPMRASAEAVFTAPPPGWKHTLSVVTWVSSRGTG